MSACIDALKLKLQQAEDAYHKLMIGGSVSVVVDQNGERVEYTRTNSQALLSYISTLRSLIAKNDCTGLGYAGSQPVGFIFR